MATYYETYIKSQQEKAATSMASARTELSAATKSQEAYRLLLRQQIEDIDKYIGQVDKATDSLVKTADKTDKTKELFGMSIQITTRDQARKALAESVTKRVESATQYPDAALASARNELGGAVLTATTAKEAHGLMERAIKAHEGTMKEAMKAAGGDPLKLQDAAIKFERFISERYASAGIQDPDASRSAKMLAAEWAGISTAEIDAVSYEKAREHAITSAVSSSQVSLSEARRLYEKHKATAGGRETLEMVALRAAIDSRETMKAEAEAERGGLEGRLEALEAATPVTEEAVRARASEIRTGDEFDPFRDRVKDAPTLRERLFKEGQFAKKQEAKRAQQQRFAKMSQAEKILMQQTIRAQRMLSESGDMLPPTRDSIEWNQAQSIYDQIKTGALEGKQAVAAAHSLAVESVGKTAPPSDIKRQRDQILERFMALRLQDQRAQRIDKPQTKTTPQDLERRAFEGTPMEGVRADLVIRRPDIVEAEEGITLPRAGADDAPVDDTEAVLASRAAGPAVAPTPARALAPTVAEEVGVTQPLLPGAVLFDDSPAPLGPELPPAALGTSDIPIPAALGTSDIPIPAAPLGVSEFTDAELGSAPGVSETAAPAPAPAPTLATPSAKSPIRTLQENAAWKEAARVFSTSQTPQDIPGLSQDPKVLAQLAEAARQNGLPLPAWYGALMAQEFFTNPVASTR